MDRNKLGTRIGRKDPAPVVDPYQTSSDMSYGYYQPSTANAIPNQRQMYPNLSTPYGIPQQQPPYPSAEPPRVTAGDYYNASNYPTGMNNMMNDQMTNLAMAYGQNLVGQGKQMMDQKLEKYVPISKLKYYFAVDTSYVRRKLTLVLFPWTNTDWAIKYEQEQEPVAPRYEVNAPDLYIPVMAFVTFLLMAGIALGVQNKFNPEQLGILSSSTLGWLILEVIILIITTYIMNINTRLTYLDIIAFCSYKYVGMIGTVCAGMVFYSLGYYIALIYSSLALCYFLVKTLRIQVSSKSSNETSSTHGNKRRMYFILCICVLQPLLMFWLTWHLVNYQKKPITEINN